MAHNTAKALATSLSDFQKFFHSATEKEPEVESHFYTKFIRNPWFIHMLCKLETSSAAGNEIVFLANKRFHILLYTRLHQNFPMIKVKPEYKGKIRICWPHNVGSNVVIKAEFKHIDDVISSFDNYYTDSYFQWNMKPGFREHHDASIGNMPVLEDWCEHLPNVTTKVDQPWYYSKTPSLGFPIYLCAEKAEITHKYVLRREISSLLRMQQFDKKEGWKSIPVDFEFIEVAGNARNLKFPELWGRYAYLTDTEINHYKCSEEIEQYIEDVICCDADNPSALDKIAVVDLDCRTHCKVIYWMAENKNATEIHNYSNYTTCTDNLYNGNDPIHDVTLKYGTVVHLDKVSSDHFSHGEAWHHFLSAPREVGYHAMSLAWNGSNHDPDVGIVFHKLSTKMSFSLKDINPYSNFNYDEDDKKSTNANGTSTSVLSMKNHSGQKESDRPQFILRVRLVVFKQLTFKKNKDGSGFTLNVPPTS